MPALPKLRAATADQERLISTPLTKPVQLLVEGGDDLAFVNALLAVPGATGAAARIQVHVCGGTSNFAAMLLTLSTLLAGNSVVKKVVILRDADDDAMRAAQSCEACFRQVPYPQPLGVSGDWPAALDYLLALQTAWILMPGNGQPGTLETLALAALAEDAGLAAGRAMLADRAAANALVPALGLKARKHAVVDVATSEKAQVQAYLSAFARRKYRLIAAAFEDGVLDVSHAAFDGIRRSILAL